jgi:hypothetical protein
MENRARTMPVRCWECGTDHEAELVRVTDRTGRMTHWRAVCPAVGPVYLEHMPVLTRQDDKTDPQPIDCHGQPVLA